MSYSNNQMQNHSNNNANTYEILFYDTVTPSNGVGEKAIVEINFNKPCRLIQIRIVRQGIPAHGGLSLQSYTQPIKSMEGYYRDFTNPTSTMKIFAKGDSINDKPLHQDTLIPIAEQMITDRIVLRGEFRKMTVCIYGFSIQEQLMKEINILEPIEKYDLRVSEEMKTVNEKHANKISILNNDLDLENPSIVRHSKFLPVLEKRNYHVSSDNIRPRFLGENEENSLIEGEESLKRIENLTKILNSALLEGNIKNSADYLRMIQELAILIKDVDNSN